MMSVRNVSADEPIPRRVFVGGIGCETTEEQLHQLFQCCGPVIAVNIIRDYHSTAYGFITFMHEEHAQVVLAQRLTFYMNGKRLRVGAAFLKSKPRPTFR